MQLASDQQEARYERDPWEEVIEPWLKSKESTTISEVLEKCINKPQAQWTQTNKIRAARCLKAQGWLRLPSDGNLPNSPTFDQVSLAALYRPL